ncbi:hypothetical protein ACFWBF_34650 [Streptomyces sp. NPDC060028]|uniref:hypothetical protein n=1 Tax=Streptomyces sp. NPDC060028 TaxID=3347041 RepID=UPI0036C0F039
MNNNKRAFAAVALAGAALSVPGIARADSPWLAGESDVITVTRSVVQNANGERSTNHANGRVLDSFNLADDGEETVNVTEHPVVFPPVIVDGNPVIGDDEEIVLDQGPFTSAARLDNLAEEFFDEDLDV